MSTYIERSILPGELVDPAGASRRPRGPETATGRAVLAAAWEQLWKRTAGGSFERLPDPARHPECWFKFI